MLKKKKEVGQEGTFGSDVIQSLNGVQFFCNPMDCSLPGYSVHEIFQARILEWVAISFSEVMDMFITLNVVMVSHNIFLCQHGKKRWT